MADRIFILVIVLCGSMLVRWVLGLHLCKVCHSRRRETRTGLCRVCATVIRFSKSTVDTGGV